MNARSLPDLELVLNVRYATRASEQCLGSIGFPGVADAHRGLCVDTGLTPLGSGAQLMELMELIDADAVKPGTHDSLAIRFATTETYLLAALELPETATQDIASVSSEAYRRLTEFNARSTHPHVVRIWNYMDDINRGDGDLERYKQFCVGRAQGWVGMTPGLFPAASAIGRPQRRGTLLVYWLASKQPGLSLENPRQVSAFNYPREYGPTSPGFARATLLPTPTGKDGLLMISGTASIVGHASRHENDVTAQTHETLNNLEALIGQARLHAAHLPEQLGSHSLLKIYVRDPEHAATIEDVLRSRCATLPAYILLHADICRRELLLEMDCVHGLPPTV